MGRLRCPEKEKIMRVLEGNLVAGKIRVGIVCARFNEFIVSKLLSGAQIGRAHV